MGFYFIVIVPLSAASSLSLDIEYLYLVDSSVFPSMVVQQLVVILVLLEEEMSTCPSTPEAAPPFFLFFVLIHILRRSWQPTPLFLPGESYGLRSLVGYHP